MSTTIWKRTGAFVLIGSMLAVNASAVAQQKPQDPDHPYAGSVTGMFHDQTAGEFLCLFSLLCPFLYLSTTLTSIINGLGKTKDTFLITCVSQSMKLFCLIALVPHFGIMAYIYGTILSQAFMALLCYLTARHLLA